MEEVMMEYFLENDFDNNIIQAIVNEAAPRNNVIPDRIVPVYSQGYMENIIPSYNVNEFRSHFRMTREDVVELCTLLEPHLPERHLYISLEKKVLFSIWIISKQESFLAVSDRFGFSRGSGHYIFVKVVSAIVQLKEQFIQWPNPRECDAIAARIEHQYRIPGVVGTIDGCHINIKQPTNNAVDFYNRKEQHSIILQAVCNDNKMFTDVFIGMPGRVHDARVFRNSPLYDKLVNNPPLLPANQHIVGDAAYPLLTNLIKPFRDNGHLTQAQTRFNEILSAARSVVERAFALLKGKWRRLKFLDMSLPHKIPEVILAACILHNYVLKRHTDENEDDREFYNNGNDNTINEAEEIGCERVNNSGTQKREFIVSIIQQNT